MGKRGVRLSACVLALALLACSGDDGDPAGTTGEADGALGPVQGALDEARAAGSVRTTIEMSTDFGSAENVRRGEGEYDFDAAAGMLSQVTSTGEIRQPIEMIVVGSDLYTQYPENSPEWFRSDWVADGEGVGQPALVPAFYLEMLAAAGDDDVEVEGTEEVDGVETTRYVVDLSFDEVLDGVSSELAVQIDPVADAGELHPFEVWIDDDGLVRRLEFAITLEGLGSSGGDAEMSGTLDLYDYGAEVSVEPPETFEESP